jgi:DNA-binding NarL/FixJ family response regulator
LGGGGKPEFSLNVRGRTPESALVIRDIMEQTNSNGGRSVTCIVADDHPAVVDAISLLLEANGVEIIGRVRDGWQALAEINSRRPRIALLDIRMPGMSGMEVARQVAHRKPSTCVILYTGYAERELLAEALDAGARGFVLKDAPLADLVRAIDMVAGGAIYVDPAVSSLLSANGADDQRLTARERDVLRLLADGLANGEIGRRLFISAETVRTHIRKAMRKLTAETRTQAVAEAIRRSLIG